MPHFALLRPVLYSSTDEAWKIADFGLTVEAAISQQTRHSRGTPCYRAPELLAEETSREYDEKVDIWAIGCIFYEVLFSEKAFRGDWETLQFKRAGRRKEIPSNGGAI